MDNIQSLIKLMAVSSDKSEDSFRRILAVFKTIKGELSLCRLILSGCSDTIARCFDLNMAAGARYAVNLDEVPPYCV
jgi:hypothetical protein